MKVNFAGICFGLVFLSLFMKWFDPVTTPGFSSWNFPLWDSAQLWPPAFTPLSYGFPSMILCCIGYFGSRTGQYRVVSWAAFLLFFLGLTFALEITCWQPTWLKAAADGGVDFKACYTFAVTNNIPDAVRGAPEGDLTGDIDGLLARFNAGLSALSYGWAFFISSSFLSIVAGCRHCHDWSKLTSVFVPATVLLALGTSVQVWHPIAAELQVAAGANAATGGRFYDGLRHLRGALALDQWNRLRPDIYAQIGSVYEVLGQRDQPEFHLYRASQFAQGGQMPEALFELEQAGLGARPGDFAMMIKQYTARVAQQYGNQLYNSGRLGDAKKQWELSIAANPYQVAGYYLSGTSCYQTSDYFTAIDYFKRALSITTQPTLIAETRSSLGDCYLKLGNVEIARSYYQASRLADDRKNYRALKSLTESYYK